MDNKYNYFNPSNKVYMAFLAVLIIVMFYYGHITVGIITLSCYAVLVIYNIRNLKVKKNEWKKFIEDFSSKLDIATRNTIVNLPFPLIMVGNKGNILWYNQHFTVMIEDEEVLGKTVNEVISDVNIDALLNGHMSLFKGVNYKNKFYDIYSNTISIDNNAHTKDDIILLYFYDCTEMIQLKKQSKETKEAVMLIEVDNLDEVIKSTEEDRKPLLIAEIERKINNYAMNIGAMLKKYHQNKYVLSIQNKNIEDEMEKKFDILDEIRSLNEGNKLEVTLSVGIGRGGENPSVNYNYAVSAKELALGRGGDQVVIKNGDKLLFYGGKSKEVEKRTRVRARVISHALRDLINESSNVFIIGHLNPDIDCLGAAVGMNSIIRNLAKECHIIIDKRNRSIDKFMDIISNEEGYDDVFVTSEQSKKIIDENSLLIVLDVHNESYVANYELVDKIEKVVIIDHHRRSTNTIKNTLLSYIEPYASSTCELVTEMIQYMVETPTIKKIEAVALMAGIFVDTKNFYFKTGTRTFEAASYLRKLGADSIDVKSIFSDDLDTYFKRVEIIKSVKVKNGIAIAICPPEIEDNVLAAQAADEMLNITGIQASFVIVKIENDAIISGRSLGNVNVQLILESLGGGGHMTIAGTRLKEMSLKEAEIKLNEAIDNYVSEGE